MQSKCNRSSLKHSLYITMTLIELIAEIEITNSAKLISERISERVRV